MQTTQQRPRGRPQDTKGTTRQRCSTMQHTSGLTGATLDDVEGTTTSDTGTGTA